MCGIFGILANNGTLPPLVLERATDSLAHRGPDDRGTVVIQAKRTPRLEIGLGSRRLAVLDLSPQGHQPMHDAETGNWIVYDGETYNFRELRTQLQDEGVRFVGQSDTEVLLKAFGRWGEKCLGELRGMFAFAIWDAKKSRLLLGRDPMGIKPLYYLLFRGPIFPVCFGAGHAARHRTHSATTRSCRPDQLPESWRFTIPSP